VWQNEEVGFGGRLQIEGRLLVDLSDRSAIFESESGRGFRTGIDPDHDAIEGFVLELEAH